MCPRSATIPGFVCHHLPPQTCFRVTQSIPMGKRQGFAFCVPPNIAGIRINIYEPRGTVLAFVAAISPPVNSRGCVATVTHGIYEKSIMAVRLNIAPRIRRFLRGPSRGIKVKSPVEYFVIDSIEKSFVLLRRYMGIS